MCVCVIITVYVIFRRFNQSFNGVPAHPKSEFGVFQELSFNSIWRLWVKAKHLLVYTRFEFSVGYIHVCVYIYIYVYIYM